MNKFFVLIAFPFFSFSQAKVFIPEMSYTFDTINEGGIVYHEFEIYNIGDKPLFITRVRTSCGCDVPSWLDSLVLPQERVTLGYNYYSSNRIGYFSKTMALRTNDTTNPRITFKINGYIKKLENNRSVLSH